MGAARPQTCAKESSTLWTLLRGWSSERVRFTRRLPLVHACCLSRDKQDGLRHLAFLFRRVEIAIRAFSYRLGLSALAGSVRVWAFLCGDLDGVAGVRGRSYEGNGTGGAALAPFCATASALQCFPRGVRWGSAPQTAPKSLRLSGLSSGAGRVRKCVSRGGVVLVRIRRAVARVHGKTRPALIYGRAGRAV